MPASLFHRLDNQALRWVGLLWMALFMLWLPLEDLGAGSAVSLAAGLCLWLLVRNRWQSGAMRLPQWLLRGLLAGLGVVPLAMAAMAFKTGLHSHDLPDFAVWQVLALLDQWPWWLLAGGLTAALGYLGEMNRT
jgi:hypothetical protein